MESVAVVFQCELGGLRYGEVLEVRTRQDTGDQLVLSLLEAPSLHNNSYTHTTLVRTTETLHLSPELVQGKFKLYDLWNFLISDEPSFYLASEPRINCVCGLALEPSADLVGCFVCRKIYHEACKARCPQCGGDLSAFASIGASKRLKVSESKEVKKPSLARTTSSLINTSKYPLLTPERTLALEAKLNRIQQKFQSMRMTMSEDEKVRQQIRDKLTAALLLAQEEQGCLGVEVPLSETKIEQLAMEIEAFMYITNDSRISSPGYKNRIRALQFNLTDVNNPDFRSNVLRGTISAPRLGEMESKDMASSVMKQLRQARELKYFEEQILCQTTGAKLMVKTHKGEAVIEINEATVKESSSDLLETITHKHLVEEDPFDPDVYEPSITIARQVDSEVVSLTKDWLPEATMSKMKDRFKQYFTQDQAQKLMDRVLDA
jgi:hypothetical protein